MAHVDEHYLYHMDEREPCYVRKLPSPLVQGDVCIPMSLADREQNALILLGAKAVTVGPMGPCSFSALLETDGTFTYGHLHGLTSWHLVWHLKQLVRQTPTTCAMIVNLQSIMARKPVFALSLIHDSDGVPLATVVDKNGGL